MKRLTAPTKFVPLSLYAVSGHLSQLRNRSNVFKNALMLQQFTLGINFVINKFRPFFF